MGRYNDFELDLRNVKVGGDIQLATSRDGTDIACPSAGATMLTNCCGTSTCSGGSRYFGLIGNDVNAVTGC